MEKSLKAPGAALIPHESLAGGNLGGKLQLSQVGEGEIGAGRGQVVSLAANLNHTKDLFLRIKNRRRHQLLNGSLFGLVAIFWGAQPDALEEADVFNFRERIEEFYLLRACGMSGDRRGTRDWDGASSQLIRKQELQETPLQAQQSNLRDADTEELA